MTEMDKKLAPYFIGNGYAEMMTQDRGGFNSNVGSAAGIWQLAERFYPRTWLLGQACPGDSDDRCELSQ